MNAAQHLDHTMTALADPTRRDILMRLGEGSARVTALAEPFALSLNAVSKHIRILERAQLVKRQRRGREHWLSRNEQPLLDAMHFMEALKQHWEQRLDRLENALAQEEE